MSNILLAQAFEGQEVRVVGTPDEPWFVASDVCAVLELSNVSQAVSRLESWMKDDITTNDVIGREQSMLTVNEPGLYALVFTSRKPEAKAFQRWVFSEVLPSIRKTGQYQSGNTFAAPRNFLSNRNSPWEQLDTPEEMIKRFEWVVKRVGMAGCFDYGYGKAILNDIIDAHHLTLPIPYSDEIFRREALPKGHEYHVLRLLLQFLGLRFENGRMLGFDGRSAAFPSEKMPRYLAVKAEVVEDFCDGNHWLASCIRLMAVHNNALVDVFSGVPEKGWFFATDVLEKAWDVPLDLKHLPPSVRLEHYGLKKIGNRLCPNTVRTALS